ncbi:hypothetical protein Pint_27631 [Pistacia integerrima]|uniref:Uncharacterized protein n=1 Tax=Pistacia integerrima TaxID=434235 RepID=A0ACC0YQV1_9ROSI|nr:hypothetical protein Pint_27631 [Pistacia integerrima]
MALEAVVSQQEPCSYGFINSNTFGFEEEFSANYGALVQNGGGFGFNNNVDSNYSSVMQQSYEGGFFTGDFRPVEALAPTESSTGRRKRRRANRSNKNKEELENQRMTHITVERNRRKQMNDYLNALRSLMPPSYIQRGDQASIVGGAINYVKELEQLLQSLEVQKRNQQKLSDVGFSTLIFSDFFSFPQYSTLHNMSMDESMAETPSDAVADVEVTLVETHANLKIMTNRHPKQLVKIVSGLISLGFHVLHLNVTTADHKILYSFSVKVEEICQLRSVNEIAAAVNEMVGRIEEDVCSFNLDHNLNFIF